MPKITIYESDLTGSQYTGDEIVVFLPGNCIIADGKADKNGCILIPEKSILSNYIYSDYVQLITNVLTAKEIFVKTDYTVSTDDDSNTVLTFSLAGTYTSALDALNATSIPENAYQANDQKKTITITKYASDDSYLFAEMLTNKGFQVLYYSGAINTALFENTWFKDKNEYNIKYLTTGMNGSLPVDKGTALYASLISICNSRMDCVALIDTLKPTKNYTYDDLKKAVQNVNDEEGRAALFADWGYIDALNNKMMPGSYFYLSALGDSVNAGKKWDSIAGVKRGVLTSYVKPVALNLSKYDLDNNVMDLTAEGNRSYNGIVNIRPYGWTIWGDRTLRLNNSGTGLKATSFLSIRVLVCDIAKRAYQSAINNTFESNNDVTWMNYKTSITQLLDKMVADYKLADYKIVKLPSDRVAQIKCKIRLVPIEPVEDFDIYINLENATANIEEQG